MLSAVPRALNADERRVLELLLTLQFTGVEQLRAQASAAIVVGQCQCGCPTIDLMVPADLPAAPLPTGLVPAEAHVTPTGDESPGQVLLFCDNGRLSSMEYVYFDEPPKAWPAHSRLHPTAKLG